MKKPYRSLFFPALFIATIGLIATDVYLPSFPAIKKTFLSSNSFVQLSFALYLFTFGISQAFYGSFSEHFGRKKVVLSGLAFSLIGTLISLFSPNITMLIVGRILQGIGFGATAGVWRAILRDAFHGNELAQLNSLIAVGTACGMALAPTLGGYLEHYFGWRSNFMFICAYTLFGIGYIWHILPETLIEKNAEGKKFKIILKNICFLYTNPLFLGYALCGAAFFSGVLVYLTASPFLFQEIIGLSAVEYGWLAFVIALALALGGYINSLLVKKVGRCTMLWTAISIAMIGALSLFILGLLVTNTISIMVPMFFYVLGVGIGVGNCSAGALHHFPKLIGFAGGLYGTTQVFFGSLCSILMSLLKERSQIPLSIFLILLMLLALILFAIAHRAETKQQDH